MRVESPLSSANMRSIAKGSGTVEIEMSADALVEVVDWSGMEVLGLDVLLELFIH
jgi:hypothetical protein